MSKPELSQAIVCKLLKYDPTTGSLTWRWRDDARPQWNVRYAGKAAGYIWTPRTGKTRYLVIGIFGWSFRAHRLIWLYMTGAWPSLEIDHADGDGLNNRWSNLRQATRAQNVMNSGVRMDNKCGLRGVCFNKFAGRFQARIQVDGKGRFLGYFDTKEEAHAAYLAAAVEAYGEFAA
jgi:hypothetical protein